MRQQMLQLALELTQRNEIEAANQIRRAVDWVSGGEQHVVQCNTEIDKLKAELANTKGIADVIAAERDRLIERCWKLSSDARKFQELARAVLEQAASPASWISPETVEMARRALEGQ